VRRGELVLTGFVPDRELAALYRRCALFVFPSLYEGAGLPILEAMACGAPVAGSSVSSVPEILGDGGATFDPASPQDIAETLERVLDDPDELQRLRRISEERVTHFTWERVARLSLEGYERALARPGHRDTPRSQRKRVAFFTPWPPDELGAARIGRDLAEDLSRHADVDVFVGGTDLSAYEGANGSGVNVWLARDFDWVDNLRAYDRVLYAIGDDPAYLHSMQALVERPGTVLAHEVRLSRLYRSLQKAHHEDNHLWMRERLFELYGDRLPPDTLRQAADEPGLAHRFGIYMTRDVQLHADRVLVHSRYAADVLRMDRLPEEAGAEAEVVPLPVRTTGQPPRPPEEVSDPPVVVSHAATEGPESIDLLLHGFAELLDRYPGARLALLGEIPGATAARLVETAGNLGLDGALDQRGFLEEDAYRDALARADAAVELRTSTDGEASAAVCDLLAARVPTIVSELGWFGELPEPAVLRVARECSPAQLADRIEEALRPARRKEIREAQDELAGLSSPERVAERFAELLSL
jgi:glycosyltransferase involved in cell wall biosynthesis